MILLAAAALTMPSGTAIMIHGAGGGGWEYDKWRPVFRKAGWQVVAPDLVPDGSLESTKYSDYEDQVQGWSKGAKRPIVAIGASLGGILALSTANRVRPDAIVLVNPAPPKGYREPKGEPAPSIVRWANGPLKDTEDAMPDSDRKTILWAHPKWRDESGAVLNAVREGIVAPTYYGPVLMVIGRDDTDIPAEISRKLAIDLKADVSEYAGMSHVGPLLSTRAEEVAKGVTEWLARRPVGN